MKNWASAGTIALAWLLLFFVIVPAGGTLSSALALIFIWGVAALSLGLVNGQLGILSLGHHGFMLIGGYVTALLMLPAAERAPERTRLLGDWAREYLDLTVWLQSLGLTGLAESIYLKFAIALLLAGLVSALFGVLVGLPALRLRGDYLAIVTLAFGEVMHLLPVAPEVARFTNGALGVKGIPPQAGAPIFAFIVLLLAILVFSRIKFSSYGRALAAIREDEIAAQAMGVHLASHKVSAFVISAFFAGVAGGMYASFLQSIDPQTFSFFLTFYLLVAVSVGGLGSITGALLGTALVVLVRNYGGLLEAPYPQASMVLTLGLLLLLWALIPFLFNRIRGQTRHLTGSQIGLLVIGGLLSLVGILAPQLGYLSQTEQLFGLRRILLALALILVMLYRREGLLGTREFSWNLLRRRRVEDADRLQDAWLRNPELFKEEKGARDKEGE